MKNARTKVKTIVPNSVIWAHAGTLVCRTDIWMVSTINGQQANVLVSELSFFIKLSIYVRKF